MQLRYNEKLIRQFEQEALRIPDVSKPSAANLGLGTSPPQPMAAPVDSTQAPKDWLLYTIKLLSSSLADDIAKLQKLTGKKKKLGVFRTIRTNKFLEFTAEDLATRDKKIQEKYDSLLRERKIITHKEAEKFFERLIEDGNRRYLSPRLLRLSPINFS